MTDDRVRSRRILAVLTLLWLAGVIWFVWWVT